MGKKNFLQKFCYYLFSIGLFLSALGSMAVYSLPLPWIGFLLLATAWLSTIVFLGKFNYSIFILLFFFFSINIFLSIYNYDFYNTKFPSNTTSSYQIYILLRYLKLICFFATISIIIWLCRLGYEKRIHKFIVWLGVLVSVYAIYIYLAQINGLPELLPRNRIGTNMNINDLGLVFEGNHRAMGSFLEPGHLSAWLVVPFILSVGLSKKNLIFQHL